MPLDLTRRQRTSKGNGEGAGETAQWLRVLVALSEDWSLVPSAQVRQLTTAHNSSPRGTPCPLLASAGTCVYTTHIHKHCTYKINNKINI